MKMMIAMMTTSMLLCIRVSVLMTTNAAFLHSHLVQASHELGIYEQEVLSPGLSRKLLLKKMIQVEGYEDQDLVIFDDQKEALSDEPVNKGEKGMVNEAKGSDPTHFSAMDYSHVRRRRPIHNHSSPKPTNSP